MSKRGPRIAASPARLAALAVGKEVRLRKAFTQEVIASRVDSSDLSAPDRAFATRLSLGVTSTWGTLDEVINRFLRDAASLQPEIRDALRISTYEILFLDKASHAAVDQGVELVKSVNPKASGLANAVLRKISAAQSDFPFGDPATDIQALARSQAFPVWLTRLLVEEKGLKAAKLFMEASNQPAPLFLAINANKTTDEEVLQVFAEQGCKLGKVAFSADAALGGCYRLMDTRALQQSAIKTLFGEGKILISDASAQMVASLVCPKQYPASFLEIASGRGTKTILLQSNAQRRFGKQMPLSSLDNHAFKIDLLKKRAKVYGVSLKETFVGDATSLKKVLKNKYFDHIFIDAPCSGLGTLRRHPEIRWRLKPEDITSLAELGLNMLREAASYVSPGGTLSYATCTVTRAENEEVIRDFLKSSEGEKFEIQPLLGRDCFATTLTPDAPDAHFAVNLLHRA